MGSLSALITMWLHSGIARVPIGFLGLTSSVKPEARVHRRAQAADSQVTRVRTAAIPAVAFFRLLGFRAHAPCCAALSPGVD
jgi:hypothetical protein